MYTPERRPLQSAIAALLFASAVTFATVAPEPAHADAGKSRISCLASAEAIPSPRHILA